MNDEDTDILLEVALQFLGAVLLGFAIGAAFETFMDIHIAWRIGAGV